MRSYVVEVWDAPRYPEGSYTWVEELATRSFWRAYFRAGLLARRFELVRLIGKRRGPALSLDVNMEWRASHDRA
jgi:hypothetical protein